MNIYKKLNEARKLVREGGYKKDGRNDYSKYDYFTPEMIEHIVWEVCNKTGIICICNLLSDEYGYYQQLELRDLEKPEDVISFTLRTEKGELKATNATQQMGGTDTYSERYIKMKVFQIKDNNLDFDSKDNTEQSEPVKTTMSAQDAFNKAKQAIENAENLDQLSAIDIQIKNSKNIPDSRSTEGKKMREELKQLSYDKSQQLISNGEVPFN